MVAGTRDNPLPSYPGRANFSPTSLSGLADSLHEDRELIPGR